MVTKPVIGQEDWGPVLNGALDSLQGSVDTNAANVSAMAATVTANSSAVTTLTGQVTALQGDVGSLQSDVGDLQGQVAGKTYYRLVAASTANSLVKAKADYVCDGVQDEVQIQAAIAAAQAEGGGIVVLSVGNFVLSAPVEIRGTVDEDNPKTISLYGCGEHATTLSPAANVNGILLTDWAQCHLDGFGIVISGSGSGITSTAVLSGNEVSFWDSSFRNLRINGGFTPTNTGWALDLAMPWRSVFENIEVEGTRNGIRLSNQGTVQNAGDCVFNRMFIEIVGTGGTAIHVSSPSNNMNQNNFFMVEAGANSTGCTGILIDGASGGASQRFYGLNLEQFQTLINVANGESNVFDCNYVTCDTGQAGNKAFVCGTNSYNNVFSAKWLNNASADTVKVIEDNNTTSNTPNVFEKIRIENNATGTITYSKTNSTVFRDITTFNTGNAMPAGLLQYPLSTVNNPTFAPADHGLITWTHDPATCRSVSDNVATGTVYLCKVKIVDRSTVVSNILLSIVNTPTLLTAGQNFVGLYDSSGTRLAVSADQSSAWTGAGLKTAAITPQTLAVGSYYVAILANFTGTAPQFMQGNGASASALNAGLTTGASRFLNTAAGNTALPASITLSAQSTNLGARWVALS